MKNSANIWRDENGVCHIEADEKVDAYRLMGYAHGRDRGMQILLMRILGQGRASEMSVWFGGRSREEIYRQALSVALASPPEKWGEGRRVVMKNIVFDGRLPRFLGFDRGPITIAGSLATPHQGQVFESAGRQTSFAPSFRMVVDTAADEIHTNMAGGPSDRRFSKWYCSDLKNWEAGIYKKVSINGGGVKAPFK